MAPKGKQLTEEQVRRIREASNYRKLKEELHISEARVKALRNAGTLEEALALAGIPPKRDEANTPEVKPAPKEKREPPSRASEPGGAIVTASAPKPAAVIFTLGAQRIDIDPQKLYESYLLYLDLRAKAGITDSFGAVMLDAMGLAWKLLIPRAPQVSMDGDGNTDAIIQTEGQKEVARGRSDG